VDDVDQVSALSTGDMQKTVESPYETREAFAKSAARYYRTLKMGWTEQIGAVSFLANRSAAHMVAALSGEPGKCFTLAETVTGISKLMVINGVDLRIGQGNIITCSWTCLPADTHAGFFPSVPGKCALPRPVWGV
jgi:hypothetical protein